MTNDLRCVKGMAGMKATEGQKPETAPRKRSWLLGAFIVGPVLMVAIGAFWSLTDTSGPRVFSLQTLPRDGRPAFVSTVKPTMDLGPLSNLPLRQQIVGAYMKLKMRIAPPKPNPAAYTFPASPDRSCMVYGLLNQCREVTGTRYLLAREGRGDAIDFGHPKPLNGMQWVAAFEQALQSNGYEIIRESSGVVKVIPKQAFAEYEKAGLVKRRKQAVAPSSR
jgi:hypothetical protein